MNIFSIFLCLVVFCSCDIAGKKYSNQHVSPRYVILAEEINYNVTKKLSHQFRMSPVGEGGSLYDSVRELYLAFSIKGPLTREQLRVILVTSVEEFLSEVNKNEEIRPYLHVYPFTSEEIEVSLVVVDKRGEEIYDPDIGSATARKGKLIYNITDKNDEFNYKPTITESYEDAFNIVNAIK